jgi:CubicO group peptidase (beta-lactamase class C family)
MIDDERAAFYAGVEQQIEKAMQRAHVPGLALAVVQSGRVTYAHGFGVTSVEDGGLPVTPLTLFRIGSATKPMTGAAIMRLVDDRLLELDRPIIDYVPWLSLSNPEATPQVTMRMLLSHTAGLPTGESDVDSRDPDALERYAREAIPTLPLIAPPGTLWAYSNPGLALAGYVAEVVAGKPYAELMQTLLFDPLEMGRTTFDPTVAMTYPLAQSHDLDEDGTLRVQHRYADNVSHYPAGFIISNVLDVAHFAIMQMSGGMFGKLRVLSPEAVTEMHSHQVPTFTGADGYHGLTFFLRRYHDMLRVSHGGAICTFGARLDMIPEAGVAVIALFNRLTDELGIDATINRILNELLGLPETEPASEAIEPDRTLWPQYQGTYLGGFVGLVDVFVEGDRLVASFNGERASLTALRSDLYVAEIKLAGRVSIGFVVKGDDPVQHIAVNGMACRRYERTDIPTDPATWATYAGTFASFITVAVRIENDELLARASMFEWDSPCTPLGGHRFVTRFGIIEFLVADDGSVQALRWGEAFTLNRQP